jgi:hypothetical protein
MIRSMPCEKQYPPQLMSFLTACEIGPLSVVENALVARSWSIWWRRVLFVLCGMDAFTNLAQDDG